MKRIVPVVCIGLTIMVSGPAPRQQRAGPGTVTVLAERDIAERLHGRDKATVVEPDQAGKPLRHAGPVFGYVLEVEYEWAINDRPALVLKAGDTFYEPAGWLSYLIANPDSVIALQEPPAAVSEGAWTQPCRRQRSPSAR
jgi:quercetin dioxygenase-like cupin family protein